MTIQRKKHTKEKELYKDYFYAQNESLPKHHPA
jgi:hypothetical protein